MSNRNLHGISGTKHTNIACASLMLAMKSPEDWYIWIQSYKTIAATIMRNPEKEGFSIDVFAMARPELFVGRLPTPKHCVIDTVE